MKNFAEKFDSFSIDEEETKRIEDLAQTYQISIEDINDKFHAKRFNLGKENENCNFNHIYQMVL